MATTAISLAAYLETEYRPECEYVNGEVVEKLMGKYDHEQVIYALLKWFEQHEQEWKVQAIQNTRVQLSAKVVRVPDVALISPDDGGGQVLETPPLVAIEVVSPGSTLKRYEPVVSDYLENGVSSVWIIDPERRIGYSCTGRYVTDWFPTMSFSFPPGPQHRFKIDLEEFFATVRWRKQ